MTLENQKTIEQWADEHYPNRSVESRFYHLLEEVVELGVCLGVNKERMLEVVKISFDKSKDDFGQLDLAPKEIGDCMINIFTLAEGLGEDAIECAHNKMSTNRQRTIADTNKQIAAKKQLGLPE